MESQGVYYSTSEQFAHDVEKNDPDNASLMNERVHCFSWRGLDVTVKDRQTKQDRKILTNANGHVAAGELVALMGPSGSGKTTLLNILAQRAATSKARTEGQVMVNGNRTSWEHLRHISSYVEQEDALIGSLTVRETMNFAARLALPNTATKRERLDLVDGLIKSFGLQQQANVLVGTPIRKGISGGQKRRLSVASQLITGPAILFLDEPTSGLDSAASYEVMKYIRTMARRYRLIVIASIHQPSTTTYELFDQLVLLSSGMTCYNGPANQVVAYFAQKGFQMPVHFNPAEYLLDLVNTDFSRDANGAHGRVSYIQDSWEASEEAKTLQNTIINSAGDENVDRQPGRRPSFLTAVSTLVHRSFIKSYRDVLAYGVRIAMYTGLAIMMGTVFLRLSTHQSSIPPFINAIFFGGAFMSFMAVAYVPAFLEDRATFVKERANGLYGAAVFNISNFLIGIPYLFLITLIFSIIAYWLGNFAPSAAAFWQWVMWLFLDLLAAESLVVLVSSIVPMFVVSLAITAFANGLWMCVDGFLVPMGTLNPFWKYVFHYIDYQAYVFQGMMVNEFSRRTYTCARDRSSASGYHCSYSSDLAAKGKIRGTAVLDAYSYHTGKQAEWVGILLVIIFVYRIFAWAVLAWRKS